MSWFHKDHGGKVGPILKHADYTAILGAHAEDGHLARLCYTGHAGVSETGVVQAAEFPPKGGDGKTLWRANLASERDLGDGHVAVVGGVVVTRIGEKGGHTVIGHALWTGEEKFRHVCPLMVSRMGIEDGKRIVFVTIDHAVRAIDVATGEMTLRDPVPTDQARDRVMGKTKAPSFDYQTGSTTSAPADWSDARKVYEKLAVYERDWAGTRELGVGAPDNIHLLGQGTYEGALHLDNVVVLSFKLDRDGTRHHHWYMYAASPVELLAILREDGKSELFSHGHSTWQGKL